uniref:Nicotinamide riboside kinase 2 n=1 Tax=Strigops habroptila TaxID=2489341 RepID=A0A672V0I9_STRHB
PTGSLKALPNCCVVHQDDFFKPQRSNRSRGKTAFKQWDVLELLGYGGNGEHCAVPGLRTQWKFARSHGLNVTPGSKEPASQRYPYMVIEGFLLYNYKPLIDLFDLRYYLQFHMMSAKGGEVHGTTPFLTRRVSLMDTSGPCT